MTDWNNKEEVLEAVENDIRAFKQASEGLQADKQVVMAAVKRNPDNLQYASEELRNDKEIVIKKTFTAILTSKVYI